ncbi:MAG: ECF transporter S component [Faecalibacterium sp.]|nr:ECF transporter S component [Ruminococcus sp.]MCM1392316.1 ECF transporter S component [Ruminococcus sp.]MCM1486360.1 ECF transporter S component [Faecalibacterium sp.]
MQTSINVKNIPKQRLSVKAQMLATVIAIVGAVAIPQLLHVIGAATGHGTNLGETFLPMHLPIILVGLLAGPYAGAISGFFAPLISFALSNMPGIIMLPFMMIELCGYGLVSGMLKNAKIPVIAKVLITQVGGRLIRACAILLSVYAFDNQNVNIAVMWKSITAGIIGLALQWILLPFIVHVVDKVKKYEQ